MNGRIFIKPFSWRSTTFLLLLLLFSLSFFFPSVTFTGEDTERTYDAGDLVRTARMVEGIIEPDPDFADLTGDGEVTEADLALMLRLVHGMENPELLFEETIGTGGGSIGDEQTVVVEAPTGAFESDSTLTVHRLPEGKDPASTNEHGPHYQITGIPYNTDDSLTVRLPLPEGFDPEKAFIEIGEPGFSTCGFDWQYQTLDAQYVDGMLELELEPIPEADWEMEPAIRLKVSLWDRITGGEKTPDGYSYLQPLGAESEEPDIDRFHLYICPHESLNMEAIWNLRDDLEDAYDKLNTAGFKLSKVSWPVRVYLKDLDDADGEMVSHWRGDYINLNKSLLSKPAKARVTAGHEFFHIVQGAYGSPRDNLLLDEATATWFETQMSEDSDYVPPYFSSQPRMGLRGIHVVPELGRQLAWWPGNWFWWETDEVENRGYALSSFIEFLSHQTGWNLNSLHELYEEIGRDAHPVAALASIVQGDFQQVWIDYTRELLLMQEKTFRLPEKNQIIAQFSVDSPSAFEGGEGSWGIRTLPIIDSAQIFGTFHEHDMHVQQMGMRSLRKQFRMDDRLKDLPETIRLIGEVECENPDDLDNMRLMPLAFSGQNPPVELPITKNENIEERATHRIEVEFLRQDRFFYMLGVFNDDVSEPYNNLIPITLRSYIGAYQLSDYTSNFQPYGTEPVAACRVSKALIEGDLGSVKPEDMDHPVMEGMQVLKVKLPHENVDSLHLTLDAALDPPLSRTYYDPRAMLYNWQWIGGNVTVEAIDNQGWRVEALHLDEASDDLIDPEKARTEGIELMAPAPDETAIYNFLYFFSVDAVTEYDIDVPDGTWSTDNWYISPLRIEIHGSKTNID